MKLFSIEAVIKVVQTFVAWIGSMSFHDIKWAVVLHGFKKEQQENVKREKINK